MVKTDKVHTPRLLHWIHSIERLLTVCAFCLLLGLSSIQIILRNLDRIVPAWIPPLEQRLVLALGLLGALIAVVHRAHIQIDVLALRLPPIWKRRLAPLVSGASSVICLLLSYAGVRFVLDEADRTQERLVGIPLWIHAGIIPVSFALMALHFGLSIRADRSADDTGSGGRGP